MEKPYSDHIENSVKTCMPETKLFSGNRLCVISKTMNIKFIYLYKNPQVKSLNSSGLRVEVFVNRI